MDRETPAHDLKIRSYQPDDRAAVRGIALMTADAGRPWPFDFFDRELLADLLLNYYTDFEPRSCWVAARGTQIIGYLAAALDTSRAEKIADRYVRPAACRRAFLRGAFFNRQFLQWLWRNRALHVERNRQKIVDYQAYPAHVHLNLASEARGLGIGKQLLATALRQLEEHGISGVHAWIREDNTSALHFFEKSGFKRLGRCPFLWRDEKTLLHSVAMGRQIG